MTIQSLILPIALSFALLPTCSLKANSGLQLVLEGKKRDRQIASAQKKSLLHLLQQLLKLSQKLGGFKDQRILHVQQQLISSWMNALQSLHTKTGKFLSYDALDVLARPHIRLVKNGQQSVGVLKFRGGNKNEEHVWIVGLLFD